MALEGNLPEWSFAPTFVNLPLLQSNKDLETFILRLVWFCFESILVIWPHDRHNGLKYTELNLL